MATYAYREQALIELVAETSAARRELTSVNKIGKQFQLDQMKASLQAQSAIDKQSRTTFKNLEDDLKNANKVAKQGREDALAAFSASSKVEPPKGLKGDFYEAPEIAGEFKKELQAMESNMNEFRNRMAAMDIAVGPGKTIEEDIGATIGSEDKDVRAKGIASLKDMATIQKSTIEDKKKEIALILQNRKYLEEEKQKKQDSLDASRESRKQLQGQIKIQEKLVKKVDLRTKEGKKQKKLLKEMKEDEFKISRTIDTQIKQRNRYTNLVRDSKKGEAELVGEVETLTRENNDLNRTKERAINLNNTLSAIEGKRIKTEIDATRKATKANAELNRKKQQQRELDKNRAILAKEFNSQVDAMATSFKTTLVTAIAASTAATTAFFNKLNDVNSTFMAFEEELMNAQSIFQASNDVLFGLSDQIVDFGNKYGISTEQASAGLYTLASAGLNAQESMEVLQNTLTLSMAVQGDHATVAKLTTQTIFGFGMEMSDSAELTDKFAHAINKSLIEYDDLASAVKFSMPFFVSTGQSIDQLLGSLEILTNRALEAGIAGRGLRQALAEFAQHAEDNTAAFAKMGVEITNADGSFKQLTEIAKEFQVAMGPAATDVDLMTTLLEDLNVRGATAFVHLVQNADEFEHAVNDLSNSAGSATAMADIQQMSLARSIDVIKTSLKTPFLMSDEIGKSQGFMNEYALTLHQVTEQMQGLFVEMKDGTVTGLTPLGQTLKDTVIFAMQEFGRLLEDIVVMTKDMTKNGRDFTGMITLMTMPLRLAVKLLGLMGPEMLEVLLLFKMMNGILPITNGIIAFNTLMIEKNVIAQMLNYRASMAAVKAGKATMLSNTGMAFSYKALATSQAGVTIGMLAFVAAIRIFAKDSPKAAAAIGMIAGALLGYALAMHAAKSTKLGPLAWFGAVAAGAALVGGLAVLIQKMMAPPKVEEISFGGAGTGAGGSADFSQAIYDTGGRIPMYETGGPKGMGLGSRHQTVMVEPGETIIPKTQNMVGAGGITLNMGDVNVQDGEDFADRVARALPEAIRRQNDAGGI